MKPTIDSRQLLAFATLARRGSFTLAAQELFLTQSAVSHAMRTLETDLGCRLLERAGRRVQPTEAGEQFLRHAEKILGGMRDARADLEARPHWGRGRLRVGAGVTACQHLLPAVLGEFRRHFPGWQIRVEPGDGPRQLELLRARQIDLALMPEPAGERDVAFQRLFEDELCFCVAPGHAWAGAAQAPRASLATETLIVCNQSSPTFRLLEDYFRAERIVLQNTIELGSMDAIKELAKLGLGAGVLAPWVARAELADGSLVRVPLGRKRLARVWGIARATGHHLTLGEEKFIAFCRQAAPAEIFGR